MALTPEQEALVIALISKGQKIISDLESAVSIAGDEVLAIENGTGTFAGSIDDIVDYLSQDPVFDNLTVNNKFNTAPNTQTIAAGAITYAGMNTVMDTEGGAATDDLDLINSGVDGDIIIIRSTSNSKKITVKNSASLRLRDSKDVLLDSIHDQIILINISGTVWSEISRSIRGDFANVQGADGYTYLPNGYLLQKGRIASGSSVVVITFVEPFSDTNYSITASHNANPSAAQSISVYNKTTTQCTLEQIDNAGLGQPVNADWIAIGS